MGIRMAYDLWYRHGEPPWILGPRAELIELVEGGRLRPCRAIDLGCGVGDNAIYLAQQGFEVTAVDFSSEAVAMARQRVAEAGVDIEVVRADVFALPQGLGTFDLVVDYGTSDDMNAVGRAAFRDVVAGLLRPGGTAMLWCFEWRLAWWERILVFVLPFGRLAMAPGEVDGLYRERFAVDRFAAAKIGAWPQAWAAYLLTMEDGVTSSAGAGVTGAHLSL
jgi:SAM-dependent methyltransferase